MKGTGCPDILQYTHFTWSGRSERTSLRKSQSINQSQGWVGVNYRAAREVLSRQRQDHSQGLCGRGGLAGVRNWRERVQWDRRAGMPDGCCYWWGWIVLLKISIQLKGAVVRFQGGRWQILYYLCLLNFIFLCKNEFIFLEHIKDNLQQLSSSINLPDSFLPCPA